MFSNIWNHPKTSIAGLLIAITTVAGVLSQQGITFGNLGTGTVVALISALATALLGLLSKDPGGPSTSSTPSSVKLGVWALIALLIPLPFLAACSGITVAQDIVNWTPTLQSAVATVDSTAALLAPGDAPIFLAATAGFDAASNLLVNQAKAYLANPTALFLTLLQNQAVAFQQQVNAALLKSAGIKDGASQQHAQAAINGVLTIVAAIIGLVASISSKAAVAHMAAASAIKLSQVEPLLDRREQLAVLNAHYGAGAVSDASLMAAQAQLAQAGF